ncbi:uncharacterized protein LOC133286129 [Gastrolobium bilobum]|uniref:uncharacterized protein LOC133286129 n=1 Tax=Gastrolobium bilobum TaxID=150636 RepID=UPI002AB0AE74|nr:uncharacterized protein LOC133286129 [Gastrolobium bilobum]
MQVHVINRLNHILNYVQKQNSSFASQFQPASIAYNLCKWGALILALLATFRTILIIIFRQHVPSIPLLIHHGDDDYSDTEEEDELSNSTLSSESEDDDDDDEQDRTGEYFRVRGSGNGDGGFLRRRRSIGDIFSLSEIVNSKSVVKLWDTIGFGFDHCASSDGSVVSVYGVNEEQGLRPIPTGKPPTPAVSCSSPAVVVSAGENSSGNLALSIWDTRLRRRIPAMLAEWGPSLGKTVGVESGGVQLVYVRDDSRHGLTVGDMRNVRSPLENVTESNLDQCWPNSFVLKI